jgi:hypothetical protein
MRPDHNLDAVILMATTLSSKRRPAGLAEIVAAADLIQGFVPYADKLGGAIERLSAAGLIVAADDGFTLTAIGRELMAKQPKKATTEDLIIAVTGDLAHVARRECPPIVLSDEQLAEAVRTHKATRKTPGKNLLMPKPKPDRHFKVEGRWRRAPAKR